jgi:hypothetical protein
MTNRQRRRPAVDPVDDASLESFLDRGGACWATRPNCPASARTTALHSRSETLLSTRVRVSLNAQNMGVHGAALRRHPRHQAIEGRMKRPPPGWPTPYG